LEKKWVDMASAQPCCGEGARGRAAAVEEEEDEAEVVEELVAVMSPFARRWPGEGEDPVTERVRM
jgi:hypothetical protein